LAGGLQLWTHFDVMDNLLCQIRGTKRVRLWPPLEVRTLTESCFACPSFILALSVLSHAALLEILWLMGSPMLSWGGLEFALWCCGEVKTWLTNSCISIWFI